MILILTIDFENRDFDFQNYCLQVILIFKIIKVSDFDFQNHQ
mgnify:CR=1 FL=1